jgi:hypothetical protein
MKKALCVVLLLSAVAFAAVTTIFPPGPVPQGTIGPSPKVDIAAAPADRTVVLHVLSNDWATGEAGLVLTFQLDISTDGGQTWCPQGPVYCISGTTQGGTVDRKTGALPAVAMDIPANVAVSIRGTATLNQAANSLGLGYEVLTH